MIIFFFFFNTTFLVKFWKYVRILIWGYYKTYFTLNEPNYFIKTQNLNFQSWIFVRVNNFFRSRVKDAMKYYSMIAVLVETKTNAKIFLYYQTFIRICTTQYFEAKLEIFHENILEKFEIGYNSINNLSFYSQILHNSYLHFIQCTSTSHCIIIHLSCDETYEIPLLVKEIFGLPFSCGAFWEEMSRLSDASMHVQIYHFLIYHLKYY